MLFFVFVLFNLGTGKTLALLVSALAWLKRENEDIDNYNAALTNIVTAPPPPIPPPLPPPPQDGSASQAVHEKPQKRKRRVVYYCSRTHTQLQQVIDELRSCEDYLDNLRPCLLASRSHTCINSKIKELAKQKSLDEVCRKAVKEFRCRLAMTAASKEVSSLARMKLRIWDIEDIVQYGKKNKCCPYFLSKELHTGADIVFVPYNFVLDEGIQNASKINLQDAVVIFDEAHNIEGKSG